MTPFEAVRYVEQSSASVWWGYLVFEDDRLSPLESQTPGPTPTAGYEVRHTKALFGFRYYTPVGRSAPSAYALAQQHWESLCRIFRRMQDA